MNQSGRLQRHRRRSMETPPLQSLVTQTQTTAMETPRLLSSVTQQTQRRAMETRAPRLQSLVQRATIPERRRREDVILVEVRFFRGRISGSVADLGIVVGTESFRVYLPSFKQYRFFRTGLADKFVEALERMGAPLSEVENGVPKLMEVLQMTESNEMALMFSIWHFCIPDEPKMIPAAKSSVYGLEERKETTGICPICLEDFVDRRPILVPGMPLKNKYYRHISIAGLPCSHNYHRRCIRNWLAMNHLCPICRYPMPTD